jgi:hypothetical protein
VFPWLQSLRTSNVFGRLDPTVRVEEAEVCEVRRCAGEDADLTAVDDVVTGVDELRRTLVDE